MSCSWFDARSSLRLGVITSAQLVRACRRVQTELRRHGFWNPRLQAVEIRLVVFGAAYGLQWYGSTGEICVPRVSLTRLRDLLVGGYTSLADVLRHEYGHALADTHRGLFRSRRFHEAFGVSHADDTEYEYDPAYHVSEYASTAAAEDFRRDVHVLSALGRAVASQVFDDGHSREVAVRQERRPCCPPRSKTLVIAAGSVRKFSAGEIPRFFGRGPNLLSPLESNQQRGSPGQQKGCSRCRSSTSNLVHAVCHRCRRRCGCRGPSLSMVVRQSGPKPRLPSLELDSVTEVAADWELQEEIRVSEQGFGRSDVQVFETLDIVAAWQGYAFPWC